MKLLQMWNQVGSSIRNGFKSVQRYVDLSFHQSALEELLSKNDDTDFNQIDQEGYYPFERAIVLGNFEIFKKLLQKGANPNLNVKGYHSPLCQAIFEEKEDIVSFLIENGADVNMVDGQNWTPITMAINRENIEILRILIQNNADVNMVDTVKCTPIFTAIDIGNMEMIELLIQNGANPNLSSEESY